ncbi:MBL fold metallo-hydrolase, partial [Streptomyces sp. ME02-6979-3A]|nr:MBL fold metallo-hydrolase [Streptomyces sp. ME02-6979-3A]
MNVSDVHTDSGRRLGVAEPRQEAPADLRLVPPALAAWAASALALGAPGRWVAAGAVLCACAGLGCLIAVPRIVARAEPRGPADPAAPGVLRAPRSG